jgi:glycosyltransferase involved in cell wall biosynthesis
MNICFIAGTLGQGGAERQLYYYVKSLKENGHNPYVLCLTKGDFWEKPILDLGLPVIWVGRSNIHIYRLFSIIRQISQRPTDIIHSQHFHTNLYAYFAGVILRIKAIGSVRNDVWSEISSLRFLGRISFSLPKVMVANSKAAISNAQKIGQRKGQIFFLPNVVDSNYFIPATRKNNSAYLLMIFIGSLWAPKRVDRVIRIAKICLEQNLSVKFKLFGDGEQKKILINMAKELGVLNTNLQFIGPVADIRIAYQEGDILLLTSDHEGTPNVVLEAMSCGLPVISTKVGDVPDLIENGINGYVTNFDEESLFQRIEELFKNSQLRSTMGRLNREKIIQERSFKGLIRKLEELYNQ